MHPLEAALISNPDDDQAWRVYADWLEDRGDARGRVIQRELAGDPVRHLPDEIRGGIREGAGVHEVRVKRGWIEHVAIAEPAIARLPSLLADPAMRFVRSLSIIATEKAMLAATIAQLGAAAPVMLRHLQIGGAPIDTFDPLGTVATTLWTLKLVYVRRRAEPVLPAAMPELRELAVRGFPSRWIDAQRKLVAAELDLPIDETFVTALAASAFAKRVQTLRLPKADREAAQRLLAIKLPKLREVWIATGARDVMAAFRKRGITAYMLTPSERG
ncbi:MAG: TIGR02996 domain-containing protein [Kofleriaceae bacterium]